jgi:UDP-2,4-diacetamido-2,4,6-trideoxy-beta-L-altropyranose hydrolase
MRVLFRVDASLQIGTGHVMRCLTLATALRDRGAGCRFVCRDHEGNLLVRIRQAGFETAALPLDSHASPPTEPDGITLAHADWLGATWETDAEETIEAIAEDRPDWVIVDHYALDVRWESALRPFCGKIMAIDDLADRQHDCDLLLDQNSVADFAHRYDALVPSHCARLLGPEYALLQPQYAELHPRTPPRLGPIRRILVFFGGADNHNLTGRTVSAFLALERPDVDLDVIINPDVPHVGAIREQAKGHENIILHENLPSLAPLMVKADLAIGAGGVTSWERCCLGLPSLVITLAENQKPIAAELARQGLVRWLGNHDAVDESGLTTALRNLFEDEEIWDCSRRCMELVDGQGAERVAAIVSLDSNTTLHARLARVDDETLILRWANDPLVRQHAFNPRSIDPTDHRVWFYKRLRDPECCRIYIVETEERLAIGQVRVERSQNGWEVHYALDPLARGRRLAARVLETAIAAFRLSVSNELLFGRVKHENVPSQKVFERLGFTAAEESAQLIYRLRL